MQRLSREMQLWLSLKSLQYKACNSERRNDNLQSNPATLAMATNTQWEQNPALFPPLWPCQASCPPMVSPSSSYQSFLPKMSLRNRCPGMSREMSRQSVFGWIFARAVLCSNGAASRRGFFCSFTSLARNNHMLVKQSWLWFSIKRFNCKTLTKSYFWH